MNTKGCISGTDSHFKCWLSPGYFSSKRPSRLFTLVKEETMALKDINHTYDSPQLHQHFRYFPEDKAVHSMRINTFWEGCRWPILPHPVRHIIYCLCQRSQITETFFTRLGNYKGVSGHQQCPIKPNLRGFSLLTSHELWLVTSSLDAPLSS